MRTFFRAGLSAVVLVAAPAVCAYAGDMYSPAGFKDVPAYAASSWTGFYVGVNGGYAWDNLPPHAGISDDGGFGGGQIGYNWQGVLDRHVVLGLEADIQGTGIDNSAPWGAYEHNITVDYFGTVRGRIGYAADSFLLYATGGLAYGNVKNSFTGVTTTNVYTSDALEGGYTAGAGVEYKISSSWSLKAEYLYVNLDHTNPVDAAGAQAKTINRELDTVRAGINYHFNTAYEPLK